MSFHERLATSQMSKESILRQDKIDQVEQNAAGAAAGVGEKRRRESPLLLPSGSEWENLVADIGALHLRDFRAGDTRLQQPQLPPSRSDDSLYLARRKCVSGLVHEGVQISLPRTAATLPQHGSGAPGSFYSGYGVEDDDDDSGLGAPPPAPPTLKRTRACSSSPKRRRKFRDDDDFFLHQ